jgi:hypothetical protein
MATEDNLTRAAFVILAFTTQRNDVHGKVVGLGVVTPLSTLYS